MKEWISDKKNQPIVIGIASVVILATAVFLLFWFHVFGNSNPASPAAPVTQAAVPSTPVTPAPALPGAPVAAPQMASGIRRMHAHGIHGNAGSRKATTAQASKHAKPVQVASVGGKADPFQPPYNANSLLPEAPPVSAIVPITQMAQLPGLDQTGTITSEPSPNGLPLAAVPLGRVSGIVFFNGVHAIYESGGQATIIQPGDQLPDGSGRVASIQVDGVTVDESGGQQVTIPVTAGQMAPGPGASPAPGAPGPGAGGAPAAGGGGVWVPDNPGNMNAPAQGPAFTPP